MHPRQETRSKKQEARSKKQESGCVQRFVEGRPRKDGAVVRRTDYERRTLYYNTSRNWCVCSKYASGLESTGLLGAIIGEATGMSESENDNRKRTSENEKVKEQEEYSVRK